jgi:raffinose synthase
MAPTQTQVWNVNPYCGVVGLFHLQGSSWDRIRRKFYVHDKAPEKITGQVGWLIP